MGANQVERDLSIDFTGGAAARDFEVMWIDLAHLFLLKTYSVNAPNFNEKLSGCQEGILSKPGTYTLVSAGVSRVFLVFLR